MPDIPFDKALKASQLSGEDIENLPAAERADYDDLQRRIVYGHDSRTEGGEPVEQGLGSAAQPTRNSIEAYKRWHKTDPDFKETLARMEADYAAHVAEKKAKPVPKRKAG